MDTPPPLIPPPLAAAAVTSNDKLLAILCHLSFIVGIGFILPLIVYLVKREESAFVATHAKEVLNFHISVLIYVICCIPLCLVLIGFVFLALIMLLGFICAIIGAIRVSESAFYHYPLTIRFIS